MNTKSGLHEYEATTRVRDLIKLYACFPSTQHLPVGLYLAMFVILGFCDHFQPQPQRCIAVKYVVYI